MTKDQIRFSQRVLSGVLSALLATQSLFPAIAATITLSAIRKWIRRPTVFR